MTIKETKDKIRIINNYFANQKNIFTAQELHQYLRSCGIKVTKENIIDILETSNLVFPLMHDEFVTRAGVFSNKWFSFKPTREEVKKGMFMIGHRSIPFTNPNITPDRYVIADGLTKMRIAPSSAIFSMNCATDTFSLFGEGYVLPVIFNDYNNNLQLADLKNVMPQEVKMTAWPISEITGSQGFRFGDRILCRITDWSKNIIEIFVQRSTSDNMVVTQEDLDREEWYSLLEERMIQSFEKHGPLTSVEEQISLLYLENQQDLCTEVCGSIEEILEHTKKIKFVPYGVESRLWKAKTEIPFFGPWNQLSAEGFLVSEFYSVFSPNVMEVYLINYLGINKIKLKMSDITADFLYSIFPPFQYLEEDEQKFILLNMKKRYDIILRNFNPFAEPEIAAVRKQVLDLYTRVALILSSLSKSGLELECFPQQDLIVLLQLFDHMTRMIDELGLNATSQNFPIDDVLLSLEGMEETFTDVGSSIKTALDVNTYKKIKVIEQNTED
jgi:hypothetical protein